LKRKKHAEFGFPLRRILSGSSSLRDKTILMECFFKSAVKRIFFVYMGMEEEKGR
jgi:hypothetical protein